MFTSFLLSDARAASFSAHLARLRSYAPMSPEDEQRIRTQLRVTGTWNPKIAWGHHAWRVELRPARPRETKARVGTPVLDERSMPQVKGPDIGWLMGTKGEGDEGVLIDEAGVAIEATFAAIIRFEGDTAVFSRHERALPSTTAQTLAQLWEASGRKIRWDAGHELAQLRESPAWLLNAFHGAREVTAWHTQQGWVPAPPAPGIQEANRLLWERAEAV